MSRTAESFQKTQVPTALQLEAFVVSSMFVTPTPDELNR